MVHLKKTTSLEGQNIDCVLAMIRAEVTGRVSNMGLNLVYHGNVFGLDSERGERTLKNFKS